MAYTDIEKKRAWQRAWYRSHKAQSLAANKRWLDANKEKRNASRKAWREANKERLAADIRARRAANPEKNSRMWRTHQYKRKYGMTIADFEALLIEQQKRCAICESEKPGGRWARFAVDHDHRTGRVRGLLCGPCNVNLGRIEGWYTTRKTKIDAYLTRGRNA